MHSTDDPTPHRRRLGWALGVVALLVVLAVTPPLLNVSRLQRRIAASMSASLGRPVHLDAVHLRILPVPGFTIENLVVSEDPAFGNEPVIRANTVELRLRPRSLWRRQVEISSIHFKVDEHGSGPSMNLVRNAAGRWNVQSLLESAAGVPAEPTAQPNEQHPASAAPRFPYIEATGARINLKLGEEKTPYSLTDADFALWLPNPARWQLRLEGRPASTNTNIADPGTLRLEGSLGRAVTLEQAAVDLSAHWQHAPLGEASKLLTGADRGWRGTLAVDATLAGPLSAAELKTKVHLEDLRRADFVPAQTLTLDLTCSAMLRPATVSLTAAACTLPAPTGSAGPGRIEASAETVPLAAAWTATPRIMFVNVDDAWLLDWARLFSRRIPAEERPTGVLNGSVAFAGGGLPAEGSLASVLTGTLPGTKPAIAQSWPLAITADPAGLHLTPVVLVRTGSLAPLTVSGVVTSAGYSFELAGETSAEQAAALRAMAPPLGDGTAVGLVGAPQRGSEAIPGAGLLCSRPWGGAQTCVPLLPAPAGHRGRRH